jgi:hypothetical protein
MSINDVIIKLVQSNADVVESYSWIKRADYVTENVDK